MKSVRIKKETEDEGEKGRWMGIIEELYSER